MSAWRKAHCRQHVAPGNTHTHTHTHRQVAQCHAHARTYRIKRGHAAKAANVHRRGAAVPRALADAGEQPAERHLKLLRHGLQLQRIQPRHRVSVRAKGADKVKQHVHAPGPAPLPSPLPLRRPAAGAGTGISGAACGATVWCPGLPRAARSAAVCPTLLAVGGNPPPAALRDRAHVSTSV